MNKKIIISILFCLIISLIYVSCITSIPNSLILFRGEELEVKTVLGMSIEEWGQEANKEKLTIQTATEDYNEKETIIANVNLFGIKVKEISINTLEEREVIPLGGLIGMKLYTKGVLVVGMSEIYGEDNNVYKPYENTGIKEGDTIIKIDDEEILSTDDLVECINNSNGEELKVTYLHNEKTMETNITPIETEKNNYKIGLWVRDAAARGWNSNFL